MVQETPRLTAYLLMAFYTPAAAAAFNAENVAAAVTSRRRKVLKGPEGGGRAYGRSAALEPSLCRAASRRKTFGGGIKVGLAEYATSYGTATIASLGRCCWSLNRHRSCRPDGRVEKCSVGATS